MDYEKAYNEAYAKAKELLENAHAFCKYDMEIVPELAVEKAMCKIFPELIDDQDIRRKLRAEYISDCTRNCNNELCSVEDRYGKTIISYREWLTPDQALRAAEIAKEETIEKACNWIKMNYDWIYLRYIRGSEVEDIIDEFKKAMEE